MAFLPSNWVYAGSILVDPVPPGVYAPSNWVYVQGTTLTDPSAPGVPRSPSGWVTAFVRLKRPHRPVGVMTGTGIRYSNILTKTAGGMIQ